jgi:FkbM family methyltransferase
MLKRLSSTITGGAARLADRVARPLLTRLTQRAMWWPIGHFPLRSGEKVESLRVSSRRIDIAVPESETRHQQWELSHLWGDDPYRLAVLPRNLGTVLDVGANVGFFAILARHYFPTATIHCYEPAPAIFPILQRHTNDLRVIAHQAGVSKNDGSASLVSQDQGPSLYNRLILDAEGAIQLISFKNAIDRLGETVDLLKLDCEGGEWSIMEDRESLRRVKHIAMEYHLACEGSLPLWDLVYLLKTEKFEIESLRESSNRVVGQVTARNLTYV